MFFLISEVLNKIYMFGKDCHNLKTIFTSDRYDGYVELHKTMRMAHPILAKYTVEFQLPNQGNETNFSVHVNNVITYSEKK